MKEKALEVLKSILKALHEERYNDVINCVDETEIDDLDIELEGLKEYLDDSKFSVIDEYGVEVLEIPYENYKQLKIKDFEDGSGMYLSYDLSSNGKLINSMIELDFFYDKNKNLISVLEAIDPKE